MRALVVAALAALGMTAVSSMGAPVLLDGYEVATGFTLATGVTVANSTTGLTQGSSSLQVNTTAGGWQNALQSNLSGSLLTALYNQYLTTGQAAVQIDYTATDAAPAGWFQLNMGINGPGIGWNQTSTNLVGTGAAMATTTLSWDVTSIMAAKGATIGANPTWFQVILMTNTTGGSPRTFYVDNLVAVPEPTIAAGLAISSLGLMIRRRQK